MTDFSELAVPLPLELVVQGQRPASPQATPNGRKFWKARIQTEIARQEPDNCHSHMGEVAVTIFYFPPGRMQGDVDNIVKPILDAMCRRVYADDSQVVSVFVKKFEPQMIMDVHDPSAILTRVMGSDRPVTYIRVDHAEEI